MDGKQCTLTKGCVGLVARFGVLTRGEGVVCDFQVEGTLTVYGRAVVGEEPTSRRYDADAVGLVGGSGDFADKDTCRGERGEDNERRQREEDGSPHAAIDAYRLHLLVSRFPGTPGPADFDEVLESARRRALVSIDRLLLEVESIVLTWRGAILVDEERHQEP